MSAYEEIMGDIHKSAGYHFPYPGPSQARLTPAPAGKTPFYISHFGRHGSRYCSIEKKYSVPLAILAKADSLGKLTPLGQDVKHRIQVLSDEAYQRWGELTPLGARQHRQIAKRMIERFPEVFVNDACVDARSTTTVRCILSMENAMMQMEMMKPELHIHHEASKHDTYYMKYEDTALKAQRMDSTIKAHLQVLFDKYDHRDAMMAKLFNDQNYVREQVKADVLAAAIFDLASNIHNTESCKKITLYDLYTDDELYDIWKVRNIEWYVKNGRYPQNGGKQPYRQRYLLRKMIEEADSCLKLEHPGASMRFGHDSNLMPLLCLMEVNKFGLATDNLESIDRKGWINYKAIPMGSNIQLVFYRKDAQDQDVLVKVLLNENEATLPLKAVEPPYYKWSDVRNYYLKILDAYEQ